MLTRKRLLGIIMCCLMLATAIPASAFAATGGDDEIPSGTSVDLTINKYWDDEDDVQGLRPNSITLKLYSYFGNSFDETAATLLGTKTLTAEDNWRWNVSVSLQDLLNDDGSMANLKITEDSVDHYEETAHKDPAVEYVPFSANSSWSRITPCNELARPASGTAIVVKKGNSYVFWTLDELDQQQRQELFKSASMNINGFGGGQITNAVFISGTNASVHGVKVTSDKIIFDDPSSFSFFAMGSYTKDSLSVTNGSITNYCEVETVEVSVTKTWEDNDNQDRIRPDSITVILLKNGDKYDSVEVTEDNDWSWTFSDLPKYENGDLVSYTIKEVNVSGYKTEINGYNITNYHEPETKNISVIKKWVDNNDQDGIRPEEITVRLLANGTPADTLTLSEKTGWKGDFVKVPVYDNGEMIVYTVDEVTLNGYTSSVNETGDNEFTITNTHEPKVMEIPVTKVWEDNNDIKGVRPDSIVIRLLANGNVVEEMKLTNNDDWKGSFTGVPVYSEGKMVKYSIEEVAVNGYKTSISGNSQDGFRVTNTKKLVSLIPVTGDSNNLLLFVVLLLGGILVIAGAVIYRRKHSN
ncbi:MAG: Cna B-type domain-containing protein [Clostridiales bacterium]|nr:Cna B-type domain-containing protein [Clostridiales bacterium]